MSSSWAQSGIAPLLERMKSQDADFRFMALNDLNTELTKEHYVQMDDSTENNTLRQVLALMKDSNTEVKNMAVRTLAILVPRLREKNMQHVIDTLIEYISSNNDELRDIAALALKTVTAQMPTRSTYAHTALNKLAPKLLNHVADAGASQELLIDSLDILAELITKFSANVTAALPLQNAVLKAVVPAMRRSRPAVRKRSLTVLGALGSCATSDVFTQLSVQLSSDLAPQTSVDTRKTAVQLIGMFARTCPRRLGRRLPEFMPSVIQTAQHDDDELRETCLQSIELILLRCPAEVTPFVNASIDLAISLIKHDPNYAGFDDDEEMADADDGFGDDEDDDDDLIDDDYSDDDDMSWKVRRASAKVLNAALTSRPELLAQNVTTVAPVLVSRFSEREESVRLEILDTFLALLKQMQLYSGGPQATEVIGSASVSSANQAAAIAAAGVLKRKRHESGVENVEGSPRGQLLSLVPAVAKALNREIVSKSIPTRHKSFVVLRELVVVLHGGLEAHIGSILASTEKSLKGAESAASGGSNLKADILGFFRVLFLTHSSKSFDDQLPHLVPTLAASIEDKLHRSCIEAFLTCSQLVSVLRPLGAAANGAGRPGQYKPYLLQIYSATVARLNRVDSDQEIRERGIVCLGVLLAHAGDDLAEKHGECFELLTARLTNEVTRFITVKVIAQIAASPVCTGETFDAFLQSSIAQVATLLRKSNRQLRLAAFDCLAAALSRSSTKLGTASSNSILAEVEPLVNADMDVNLLPHILRSVTLILLNDPATRESVRQSVLPQIYTVLRLPIAQGPAMESLLEFFRLYIGAEPNSAPQVVEELLAALEAAKGSVTGTHLYSTVSRCIGAVCTVSEAASSNVAAKATSTLERDGAKDTDVYFALLLLGELGRFNDFSTRAGLLDRVLRFYTADSEEVKMSAAFAVGNMAVGALPIYLPVIEQHIRTPTEDRRFLSLHALKELITHGSADQLAVVAEQVWPILFDACETKEEGVRSIGAECLARLTLSEPTKFLPLLQERLRSPSVSTRATVLAAIRFTLSTESSAAYDELLAPVLVDFLSLLADPELEVRRNATFALNSAAHNKPYLIRDHLPTLLPLLYSETHIRPELLRKVSMGPFQIVTDDGLDLRKNAYETMYQLLDTLWSRLHLPDYLDRVIAGLSDTDDGIKTLCYLMIIKLVELRSSAVRAVLGGRLEEVAEPVGGTLRSKLKETATKQEIEKQGELQRFIYKMLVVVSRGLEGLVGQAGTPRFWAVVQEAKTGSTAGGAPATTQGAAGGTNASSALWREVEASLGAVSS